MALNLGRLNNFLTYHHFEMDTLQTVVRVTRPGCCIGSLDLKDTYYSLPVAASYQKYLKFELRGQLFQFTCLPQVLASCLEYFLKS